MLKILQFSATELAGMPYRHFYELNQVGIQTRLITIHPHRLFPEDIVSPTADQIADQINVADLVHIHSYYSYKLIEPLLTQKPFLVHIHGEPDKSRPFSPTFPHVVCTPDLLREYPQGIFLPNLISTNELPASVPYHGGKLRVFKSPSPQHKHQIVFAEIMSLICNRLGKHVEYVAPQKLLPHDQLIALRQTCHISLDHLHGQNGSYGVESLESIAQGLIPINGATPTCMKKLAEVLGQAPPFANVQSPQEAAHTILNLIEIALNNPQVFEQRRLAGPSYIKDFYRMDQHLRRWIDLYQQILSPIKLPAPSARPEATL